MTSGIHRITTVMTFRSFRASHYLSSAASISLTKPITPNTLQTLRSLLKENAYSDSAVHGLTFNGETRNAAVLIPFCNVDNEPGILLEVRAKTLRSHSGEIRYVMPCKPCHSDIAINHHTQLSWGKN